MSRKIDYYDFKLMPAPLQKMLKQSGVIVEDHLLTVVGDGETRFYINDEPVTAQKHAETVDAIVKRDGKIDIKVSYSKVNEEYGKAD